MTTQKRRVADKLSSWSLCNHMHMYTTDHTTSGFERV